MTAIFAKALRKEARKTTTENGANAFNTTKNGLTDLFAIIGAMRGQDMSRLHLHIDAAYKEDKLLLAKMLFQTRDIRGGLGEREVFRESINYCAKRYPDIIEPNIGLIPEYGRWDDMFALINTPLEDKMYAVMREQLDNDNSGVKRMSEPNNTVEQYVSLLAKWLPTADASSEKTREFAKQVAKGLGFKSIKAYKDAYKPVRKYLNTVEAKMSTNQWDKIDYEHVPSRSMLCHRAAFYRHDEKRMTDYINAVTAGQKKINATTLYPYDIVEKVLYKGETGDDLNVLWNALPNYVNGEKNFLVMADVSGSMHGRPLATSIGLALYFAQHNKGSYNGTFMSFSAHPVIYKINENGTLVDTIHAMSKTDWDMNTNLEIALMEILATARNANCKQEDLPEALIIITDMEFDAASCNTDVSFLKAMRLRFKENGYKLPNIVFWNVQSRHDTYHASSDKEGITMVSGQSPSTFKTLMAGLNGKTAYDLMVETLNDKRYAPIGVA